MKIHIKHTHCQDYVSSKSVAVRDPCPFEGQFLESVVFLASCHLLLNPQKKINNSQLVGYL